MRNNTVSKKQAMLNGKIATIKHFYRTMLLARLSIEEAGTPPTM